MRQIAIITDDVVLVDAEPDAGRGTFLVDPSVLEDALGLGAQAERTVPW